MNNREIAETFTLIANLLEIKGEVIYTILAYRKAAESLVSLAGDVNQFWKDEKLREIPGVGKSIAEKIDELLRTGKLRFLEELETQVPPGACRLAPGFGTGAEEGRVDLEGAGNHDDAGARGCCTGRQAQDAPRHGSKVRGVDRARHRVACPAVGTRPDRAGLAARAADHRRAEEAAGRGGRRTGRLPSPHASHGGRHRHPRCSDRLGAGHGGVHHPARGDGGPRQRGYQVQHRVRRRGPGAGLGASAGEVRHCPAICHRIEGPQRGAAPARPGQGAVAFRARVDALGRVGEILCATETEVYAALGLPWIPPELREDRGEVQAARAGTLPHLIEVADIRADLQTHSTWSDGKLSMLDMARAAARRGIRVIAFTDHSLSLGMVGGLTIEGHAEQRAEIKRIQKELGDSILVLHASEVEIKADGSLDYPDEFLATLDLVVASLHTSLGQERDRVTQRLLKAVRNPHVDIIGHPTGRLIPDRPGADLDMDAVLDAAAKSGVALEINASPFRLDLEDVYARRAKEMGIPLSVNTDAHSEADLDMLPFGVAIARRAWLTAVDVINTWPTEKLLTWLRKRGG